MSFDSIEHTTGLLHKKGLIVFMVWCYFLLSLFLVVEDYDFSKITSHLLSMPLILECVRILSWCISFFSTSIISLKMFWCSFKMMILLYGGRDGPQANPFQCEFNVSRVFLSSVKLLIAFKEVDLVWLIFPNHIMISFNVVSVWLSFQFFCHKKICTKDLVWKKNSNHVFIFM